MCGKGCKQDWNIIVNLSSSKAIKDSEVYIPFNKLPDGRLTLAKTEEGQCVFLDDDNLCRVHKKLGFESKPRGCAQFPASFVPTPEGLYVGMSFFCTSIQEGTGRPMEAHKEWLAEAAESAIKRFNYKGHSGRVHLVGNRDFSWEEYVQLEKDLRAQLKPHNLQLPFLETPFKVLGTEPTQELLNQVAPQFGSIFAGALGLIESPDDPEQRVEIFDKMIKAQPFYSPRLGQEVKPCLAIPLFEEISHRFLDHVLFRKFLIQGHLLGRLAFLLVAKKMLNYQTQVHAQVRGGEPEEQDMYKALDLIEKHFLFHAFANDQWFEKLGEAYVEAVEKNHL